VLPVSQPEPFRRRLNAVCEPLLVAAAALTALASPAAAQPGLPPGWSLAESPGVGGFGFGLGIDFRWEDLDSLLNAADTTTVTRRDAQGNVSTQVVPGDPALNNRKFDYRFEVKSAGGQAPVALPRFSLGRGVSVYPSLVVEAGLTEVTFDFHDRTNPQDSTSITGRGASYGLGLEAVATLGQDPRWFLGAGYRYRSFPSLDLERSSLFDPAGDPGPVNAFEVTHDQVRLSQDTHLATLRLGRAFRGGKVAPYLGVRSRWTDLELDDELAFRSPLGDETALRTNTRFESDSALAVAGIDAKLGGPVRGRAEVTFGGGDFTMLLKLVYLVPSGTTGGGGRPPGREPRRSPEIVAAELAPEFERIQAAFVARWKNLRRVDQTVRAAYLVQDLKSLLDTTESDLVTTLAGYAELAPLADYIRDRFAQARLELGLGVASTPTGDGRRYFPARVVLARLEPASHESSLAVLARQSTEDQGRSDKVLASIGSFLSELTGSAKTNRLAIKRICVQSIPSDGATFKMWAESRPEAETGTETNNSIDTVWRGRYFYRFFLDPARPLGCPDPQTGARRDCNPLNLWTSTGPLIECKLDTGNCQPTSGSTAACGDP